MTLLILLLHLSPSESSTSLQWLIAQPETHFREINRRYELVLIHRYESSSHEKSPWSGGTFITGKLGRTWEQMDKLNMRHLYIYNFIKGLFTERKKQRKKKMKKQWNGEVK